MYKGNSGICLLPLSPCICTDFRVNENSLNPAYDIMNYNYQVIMYLLHQQQQKQHQTNNNNLIPVRKSICSSHINSELSSS